MKYEDDPGSLFYAAGALLLLAVLAIVVGVGLLRYFGVALNCNAILGSLFVFALVYVAIRPFVKSK